MKLKISFTVIKLQQTKEKKNGHKRYFLIIDYFAQNTQNKSFIFLELHLVQMNLQFLIF